MQALKDAGCSEVVLAINYQPKVRAARMRLPELPACARRKQRCCPESPAAARVAASGPMRGPLRRALQFWRLGLAQVMMDFLKEWEEKLAIKITCSQARRPAQPRDHPPASLRGAAAPRLSPPRHARQRGWLSGRGGRAAASPCSRNLGRSCASVCDGVPVNLQQHIGLGASVWPLRGAEPSEGCERARAAGAYPLQDSWAGAAGRHGRAGDRRSRVVLHSCWSGRCARLPVRQLGRRAHTGRWRAVSHPARAGARRLEAGVVSAVGAGALGQMEEAGALARSRRRSLWGP